MRESIACPHCRSLNRRVGLRCSDCMRELPSAVFAATPYVTPDNVTALAPIHVSTRSFAKLERLARLKLAAEDPVRAFLLRELDRAIVLHPTQIPGDVVEIGDQVIFRTAANRLPMKKYLVYPGEQCAAGDSISALSLVGVALLGLREGSGMNFNMPDGSPARVQVEQVG
jgi:regulator of nucleoside diphosphate kinase